MLKTQVKNFITCLNTNSLTPLGGGGRNALVVWVLAICTKSHRHIEQQYCHPELVSGSINIKFERLLTRIRSCTTLFCYVKNKFQGKSPPLLGRI